MIIYNNEFKFLGASLKTLSSLGYEDMSTFTSLNNDIADLFIKRSGYIHKFDNFSWINYVLNGGSPTKDVLIKLRNGNEAKAKLSIEEIILSDEQDKKIYLVELEDFIVTPLDAIDENFYLNNDVTSSVFDIQETTISQDDSPSALDEFKASNILIDSDTNNGVFSLENDDASTELKHKNILPDDSIQLTKQALDSFEEYNNYDSKNKLHISFIDNQKILNFSDTLDIDSFEAENYLNECRVFILDSISKIRDHIDRNEKDLANKTLQQMIGIANISNFSTILNKLENANSTNLTIAKEEILDEIEKEVSK